MKVLIRYRHTIVLALVVLITALALLHLRQRQQDCEAKGGQLLSGVTGWHCMRTGEVASLQVT